MRKLTLLSLTGIIALAIPLQAIGAFALSAADTVAGLGTEISAEGIASGSNPTLVVTPPLGSEIPFALSSDTTGHATVRVSGSETEAAGIYNVELLLGETVETSSSFEVLPESLDTAASSLQSDRTSITPDGADAAEVTVILRDRFMNPLPERPMELISSRDNDVITPLGSETDDSGTQRFSVTTTQAGTATFRALDLMSGKTLEGSVSLSAGIVQNAGGYAGQAAASMPYPFYVIQMPYGMQQGMQQMPTGTTTTAGISGSRIVGDVAGRPLYAQASAFDVVAAFVLDVPETMKPNEDTTMRITAVDKNGNRVEDYMGTVLLSSTDPTALLPLNGEVQFQPQNLGQKVLTLGLRLRTPGQHTIHAEDSANASVFGEKTVTVSGGSTGSSSIQITSPKRESTVRETRITVQGKGPAFMNLIISGGEEDVTGETDDTGTFEIPVELSPNQIDHTLRVRDDTGRVDSGNIHIRFDATAPEIGDITFEPASPKEGETVTLTVQSEPALASMKVKVGKDELTLVENKGASGSYRATFTAPVANTYQPSITAADGAGNTVEVRGTLVVEKRSLPGVTGVKAEAKVDAVILTWEPVTSERVDAYRIYVGETANDFGYTLETDRAASSATVAGLKGGTLYFFAVTALQGDRESAAKSETVSASPLGLDLKITPQNGALQIEWSNLSQGTPLASYLLEYGVEAGNFAEKRMINGTQQSYMLRDLLNGIPYFIRITPIATTGNALKELAADGTGTPAGAGNVFTPQPSAPVTVNGQPLQGTVIPKQEQPTGTTHAGAPRTPTVGLPASFVWIALSVSGLFLILHWHRRRTLKLTMEFREKAQERYHL
ncbi:MAG: Ig-like domain-containing protein [Candidatus Peregrinibacteria bacterium]